MLEKMWAVKEREGWVGLMRRATKLATRKLRSFPIVREIWVYYKNHQALATLTPPVKLHLGCGRVHLDDYVNIDIEDWAGVCDVIASATNLSMFSDNSVEHILNHALLEHIPPWDTLKALREGYRVLKPGGTIQIEVPDLERIYEDWLVKGMLGEDEAINNIFGGFKKPGKAYKAQHHLTGFTFDRLTRMMAQVGFREFARLEHETYHHILVVYARKPMS